MNGNGGLRNWAIFLVVLLIVTGSYYEALHVRDQTTAHADAIASRDAHAICAATEAGRRNLNERSAALAEYITLVLAFNRRAEHLSPTPAVLRPILKQELAAIRKLRAAQKPLPVLRCP